MSQSFDHDAFDRRSMRIVVESKGKSFAQLTGEIEALRREYEQIRDESAMIYIQRNLDRLLLMVAIDTCQPCDVVEFLYERNTRQGFNSLHGEVASAIEYADYYSERGYRGEALSALYAIKEKISAKEASCPGSGRNFLLPIEESIIRLQNKR
jgi:hypothetical protein